MEGIAKLYIIIWNIVLRGLVCGARGANWVGLSFLSLYWLKKGKMSGPGKLFFQRRKSI